VPTSRAVPAPRRAEVVGAALVAVLASLEGTHNLAAARKAWDHLHKLDPANPSLQSLKQKLDAAQGSSGDATSSQ